LTAGISSLISKPAVNQKEIKKNKLFLYQSMKKENDKELNSYKRRSVHDIIDS
jgi:hypothetical protein